MKKRMTAFGAYSKFIDDYGREPTREEFIELGYSRATYYRVRQEYFEEKAYEDEMLTTGDFNVR